MIGIYKITSPSNRIYIGQAIDIDKRFKRYESLDCKGQRRLFNSFMKYGTNSHTFEIIEECDELKLNERERYYQDLYNVIDNKTGLNCKLTKANDKSGRMSDESKLKISISKKNQIPNEVTRNKMSIAQKGRKHSQETKDKMSKSKTGIKFSQERIKNMKNKFKSKKVIDISTNIIYNSLTEAAIEFNIIKGVLSAYLLGIRTNKTTLKYLE